MASSERIEVELNLADQMTKAITGLGLISALAEWLGQGDNYDRLMKVLNDLAETSDTPLTPGDVFQMLLTQVIDVEE